MHWDAPSVLFRLPAPLNTLLASTHAPSTIAHHNGFVCSLLLFAPALVVEFVGVQRLPDLTMLGALGRFKNLRGLWFLRGSGGRGMCRVRKP
jgi:hypothetical protein